MLALFAFLVWGPDTWFAATPKLAGTPPGLRFPLTAFLITWAIGASALLIANNCLPNKLGSFSLRRIPDTRIRGPKKMAQCASASTEPEGVYF
jgi:hypothetical protein